jgi:hypothetical protein
MVCARATRGNILLVVLDSASFATKPFSYDADDGMICRDTAFTFAIPCHLRCSSSANFTIITPATIYISLLIIVPGLVSMSLEEIVAQRWAFIETCTIVL